jgi:hypothetical protein
MGSSSEILTPTILNVTLTTQSTEYSQALPAGCKHFSMRERSGAIDVLFAFKSGQVATSGVYATVKSGTAYTSPEKLCMVSPANIYLASGTNSTVVEIVAWV